jgi:hypothetical protein
MENRSAGLDRYLSDSDAFVRARWRCICADNAAAITNIYHNADHRAVDGVLCYAFPRATAYPVAEKIVLYANFNFLDYNHAEYKCLFAGIFKSKISV